MKTEDTLEGLDLAHAIVGKLEQHQASDIVLMDLRDITPLADFFVICSTDSERQARTLQEILLEDLEERDAGAATVGRRRGRVRLDPHRL